MNSFEFYRVNTKSSQYDKIKVNFLAIFEFLDIYVLMMHLVDCTNSRLLVFVSTINPHVARVRAHKHEQEESERVRTYEHEENKYVRVHEKNKRLKQKTLRSGIATCVAVGDVDGAFEGSS